MAAASRRERGPSADSTRKRVHLLLPSPTTLPKAGLSWCRARFFPPARSLPASPAASSRRSAPRPPRVFWFLRCIFGIMLLCWRSECGSQDWQSEGFRPFRHPEPKGIEVGDGVLPQGATDRDSSERRGGGGVAKRREDSIDTNCRSVLPPMGPKSTSEVVGSGCRCTNRAGEEEEGRGR